MRNRKGFTLIELLVVIGILAVLLAITLIAVNPAQNIQDAEDTQRRSDVTQILNAVSQYVVDNNGAVPAGITGTAAEIGDGTGQVNICGDLVPTYIDEIPQDPTTSGNGIDETECTAGTYATGYEISVLNGRVTVTAPDANNGTISVTR
jgi:type IV pilus assembly protein PilA